MSCVRAHAVASPLYDVARLARTLATTVYSVALVSCVCGMQGAVNVYTREGLLEQLLSPDSVAKLTERNIMVFHCEFSSERGPSL